MGEFTVLFGSIFYFLVYKSCCIRASDHHFYWAILGPYRSNKMSAIFTYGHHIKDLFNKPAWCMNPPRIASVPSGSKTVPFSLLCFQLLNPLCEKYADYALCMHCVCTVFSLPSRSQIFITQPLKKDAEVVPMREEESDR